MQKIKTGDEVIVIAGKDKGRRGTVLRVQNDGCLLVEGINQVKKHMKPNPQQGKEGGVVQREAPIQASNVGIFNPKSQKADRVGIKTLKDGKKMRFFKSDNEAIDA